MKYTVTFLGTGVSCAVPSLQCLIAKKCRVCMEALENPKSKTNRNNVSICVSFEEEEGEDKQLQEEAAEESSKRQRRCILVDVGKTFRQTAIKQLIPLGLTSFDAILITHNHFDALGGMDDIRDFQTFQRVYEGDVFKGYKCDAPIRIFGTDHTINTTKQVYPYLHKGGDFHPDRIFMRKTAILQWETIPDRTALNLFGMNIEVFPVLHGGDYISLGFGFGPKEGRFVYISDINACPAQTLELLQSWKIKTLVVDSLSFRSHTTHFCVDEAIEFSKLLNPEQVYLVGMECGVGTFEEFEKVLLEKEGGKVLPAFDGMQLVFGE